MDNKKQNAGRLLKVAVFLSILFLLFLFFTYLMRTTSYNARQNILGYYAEETELDVVVLGASNVYRYWDPMAAWEEEGIASRNYSVSSMHAATYLPAIKDILKTQNPKLLIVEARRFRRVGDTQEITAGPRNLLDSMDYNLSRLQAVHYFCEQMEIPWETAMSLYIDLIQYHDNYEALTTKLNWQLADNRSDHNDIPRETFKGYAIADDHEFYEDPSANLTDEISYETGNGLRLYKEMIEYCQENDVPLIFVCMPMVIREDESMTINALKEVAAEYGVPFFDMNYQYDEIGLDFATDFYDPHHVNVLGAEKVSKYLASYLAKEYDLPDHRGDAAYASWDMLYEEYLIQLENAKEKVWERIEEKR